MPTADEYMVTSHVTSNQRNTNKTSDSMPFSPTDLTKIFLNCFWGPVLTKTFIVGRGIFEYNL